MLALPSQKMFYIDIMHIFDENIKKLGLFIPEPPEAVANYVPFKIIDNIITGKLAGKASFREGKLELVKNWCSENNLNLGDAVFYSDSINDLPMLEACGKPIVVNPDEILRNLAVNRSYKIIER